MIGIYLFVGLLVLIGLAIGVYALRPASTPPFLDGEGNSLPNSIAAIEKVKLGDVEQWLAIRGRDRSKPVLLFLHGGPGTPETPFLHHFNSNLEDHFVVVAWEQRGAGKSYSASIPPGSMTLEQFIQDTQELTQILKERFGVDKIYLVGHSWGALLGILVAHRHPQDYHAYVGVSQPVHFGENESMSYQWALHEAVARQNRKALRELQAIGPPVDGQYAAGLQSWGVKGKWIRAFGGALYGRDALPVLGRVLLLSRVYSLQDKLNYLRGESFTLACMAGEFIGVDLADGITRFALPVYFCHGRHDYQAIHSLAEAYFQAIEAPRKRFVTLEGAAHGALFEEPERFLALMLDVVAETYPQASGMMGR